VYVVKLIFQERVKTAPRPLDLSLLCMKPDGNYPVFTLESWAIIVLISINFN
jgi:hypothetical protein